MKQVYKIIIIIAVGVLLQSCSIYKVSKLAKQGSVSNTVYFTQIPFNYYHDFIFVEVTINDKKYNFFLDTGAEISAIGQHIKDEIDFKVIASSKVSATSKTKRDYEFIQLPKISISNVDFENTGAIIADLSHFEKLVGCVKVDGIIGNNLLRKSVWQIDYKNKKLIITDNFEKLMVSPEASEIVMNSGKSGNVYLDVTIGGAKSKFTFDTGFTGKIKSDKQFFDLLIENNNALEYTTETGITGANLHEVTTGTTYYAYVKTVNVEGVIVNDQIISLEQGSSSLVGNQFFKNYILTLDWKNDKLFLDLTSEIKADTLKGYELFFLPNYATNKIEVFCYQDDHLLEEKVSLGAEILMINDIDVSDFSTLELCEYWEREREIIKNEKTIDMVVLDSGVRKKIKLTQKILLPK
jgi:predicted aspartyl protease